MLTSFLEHTILNSIWIQILAPIFGLVETRAPKKFMVLQWMLIASNSETQTIENYRYLFNSVDEFGAPFKIFVIYQVKQN